MKTIGSTLVTLLAAAGLTACGMVNATESMPPKMDSMNKAVDKTNSSMDKMIGQVDETNERMDQLKRQVEETNRGMDRMIEEVRRTNEGIERTNDAVHNQALAVAMTEMMKPENTRSLVPPTGMLPAGQVFANEATATEIVSLVYVYFQDIDLVMPDASERGENGEWKPETIKRVDHEKLAKFMASMVISGLAPAKTIDELIASQIDDGGRHEDTAYAVLMLRYMFLRDLQLNGALLARGLKNPGMVREAIEMAEEMERISSLPYTHLIQVKTRGMLDPAHNLEATLDPSDTVDAWRAIGESIDRDLDAKYRSPGSPAAQEIDRLRERVRKRVP